VAPNPLSAVAPACEPSRRTAHPPPWRKAKRRGNSSLCCFSRAAAHQLQVGALGMDGRAALAMTGLCRPGRWRGMAGGGGAQAWSGNGKSAAAIHASVAFNAQRRTSCGHGWQGWPRCAGHEGPLQARLVGASRDNLAMKNTCPQTLGILRPVCRVTEMPMASGGLFAGYPTRFCSDPVDAVFQALGVA